MLAFLASGPAIQVQSADDAQQIAEAKALLEQMSPEERVGQLFLVTFQGASPGPEDPIFNLISAGHISGVILEAGNNNFTDGPEALTDLSALISALQNARYEASSQPAGTPEASPEEETSETYIPLLIGISQEGNGAPYSQLLSGVSVLPSSMAVGASWDPALATSVGELLGQELSALGFNMYLGPSLDVLADPARAVQGDLGVRTFGGDPYWVSVMGRAMIEGLHRGADGRLGVIVKHFPGLGGSDRPIEEEVSTVRKSLVQLQQIELAPFIAATSDAPGARQDVADGILTGNIRYQGFQGNIRVTTRPVGLDPDAFSQLMTVEPLAAWRGAGGIAVSGKLGSRAVRRFYESLGETFRGHLVARDAFLAGNDLLYLADFRSDDEPDQVTSIQSTLAFFTQKYRDDAVFAQRVDEAVTRILQFKLRLYGGEFALEDTLPLPDAPELVGGSTQLTLEVARRGATLLSPDVDVIADQVGAPRIGERIVFISDLRLSSQCSACEAFPTIGLTALEDTVNALYGTQAAGQVGAWNLTSLTLADLAVFLGEAPPSAQGFPIQTAEDTEEILRAADWLIFLIQKSDSAAFGSNALKLMLDQRPDLARDKLVVVFAMDVPYDLDATEVSKIDLYYALYGKTSPFIEVAARLLFQELSAVGSSPVSVPGVGYDLIEATSPDPEQLITLVIAGEEEGEPQGYAVGDVVLVQTGAIVDLNGHPVPDGTPVEFILAYQGEANTFSVQQTTSGSVAEAPITLDRLGILTIQAESLPARISEILQVNVQEGVVTVITPTLQPSPTDEPTATPVPVTASPEATPAEIEIQPTEEPGAHLGHLGLGLTGIAIVASVGYSAATSWSAWADRRIRLMLIILLGGLLLYNYLALGLPGSEGALNAMGALAGFVSGFLGGGLGLGAAYLWERWLQRS